MTETTAKNSVQLKFFENLKQSVANNISLAVEIAEILEVSPDGAYRRIRGESMLSIDEMMKLCNHYNISPDFLPSSDRSTATFHFRKMINDEAGFADYIKSILNDLQKINNSEPKNIIYAAGDLPMFAQFVSPEYSAFKMFFWQKAMLSLPSMEGKEFSVGAVKPEIAEMCRKIADTYIQIPSVEIWHLDTIASNLNLVEFAWESGMFSSKEDAVKICNELSAILSLVEKNAQKSSKFREEKRWLENEGNFTMYQSEFVLMNNHIFVTAGQARILYLTHNTFNSMATTNSIFCGETEEWLKNLIQKSARISGEGEKTRHKFFRHSQKKISDLVAKITA